MVVITLIAVDNGTNTIVSLCLDIMWMMVVMVVVISVVILVVTTIIVT